ncbi:hypothetical protein G6F40_018120 [Rhizopus arrhizus]|nr:hypothetical protein G6F40_018120 [Rhizopus arrhizus]
MSAIWMASGGAGAGAAGAEAVCALARPGRPSSSPNRQWRIRARTRMSRLRWDAANRGAPHSSASPVRRPRTAPARS